MRNRFSIAIISLLIPLTALAQASGGQIRRPNRSQRSGQSLSRLEQPKPKPITDKRPRRCWVKKNVIIGSYSWILLDLTVSDDFTMFHWTVKSPYESFVNIDDIYVVDNKTKDMFPVTKVEDVKVKNDKIELIKDFPANFKLLYPALPKGSSTIDIFKGNSLMIKDLDVTIDNEVIM